MNYYNVYLDFGTEFHVGCLKVKLSVPSQFEKLNAILFLMQI
jgi:hypothetical protein